MDLNKVRPPVFRGPYALCDFLHFIGVEVEPGKHVANVFGQLDYGRNPHKKYTDYVALTNAFNEIRNTYPEQSLAFPYGFGCGLANGDWNIVSQMIETYFGDMDVTIYRLAPAAA